LVSEINLEPVDEKEELRIKIDSGRPVEYEPVNREDINITLPISVIGDAERKKATLTLVVSDTHLGDSNHLPKTFWSCVENTKSVVSKLSEKFDIVNFIMVLNGDLVAGKDVFRYQQFRNLVQRGHWQTEIAAQVIRELKKSIAEIEPIRKTFIIKGNHEDIADNYMIYLTNYLDDTWYAGHYKVLNIAYPIGNYNVLFTHGSGKSAYYPVSYEMIRDCWKAFNQYKAKGVQIEEVCVGHSIPGYRNVVIRDNNQIKLVPIEDAPPVFQTIVIDQGTTKWEDAYLYFHPYQGTMIRATSECGEIEVTTGQSVFVYENNEMIVKKGRDLEIGDRLIHLKHVPATNVDTSISAEEAWILGFYCADGWSSFYKDGPSSTYSIGFSNSNRKWIERVRDYYQVHNPPKFKSERSITLTKDGLYQLQVYSKPVFSRVTNLCSKGAKNKKVPTAIFNSPTEVRSAFLDGYYCGDGDKSSSSYRWGSSSSQLFDGVLTLIKMQTSDKQFTKFTRDSNRTDHYRGRWIKLINKTQIEDCGNFYTSPIKNIEYFDYDGMVYDLEVIGNPMFFDAKGMTLLHNTHWLQPRLYLEGLTFNVCGGFQIWEKTISQRPSGFLLFIHTCDETSVTGIRPDPEIEIEEQTAVDLEFTNYDYYGQKLRNALRYVKDRPSPDEVVI